MKKGLNEIFCPIELIEPIAFHNEFQILELNLVRCNTGMVCTTGEKEE
ncbi:MAG TPA: hypothetical protein VK186_13675 [Candidatus Deferrimicrobium sp.]|nr:hypothetical protein [Candidatus Kapabacteria bacterium]HLP59884.1 hypothetical protein [Candidatus Deferrimicrobium sp.]